VCLLLWRPSGAKEQEGKREAEGRVKPRGR
jgi:hypothetical protein